MAPRPGYGEKSDQKLEAVGEHNGDRLSGRNYIRQCFGDSLNLIP